MGRDPILLESSSEQEIWTQWMHIHGKKKKKKREDGGRGRPSTNQGEKKKTNNIL